MTTIAWPRARTDHLNAKNASLLMADVDRVWLSSDAPEGGFSILTSVGRLSPEEAAESLLGQMGSLSIGMGLSERLALIGIAVGTLSHNRGVARGVRGIWRSTLPIVLVSQHLPRRASKIREVAEQVGYLIYGATRDHAGRLMATDFATYFKVGLAGI